MKASEKMYWIKAGLAVAVAVISTLLQVYFGIEGLYMFMLGITIYLVSSDLLSNMMSVDRGRSLRIGVGAYLFIWLMVWTLLYTYIRTA